MEGEGEGGGLLCLLLVLVADHLLTLDCVGSGRRRAAECRQKPVGRLTRPNWEDGQKHTAISLVFSWVKP